MAVTNVAGGGLGKVKTKKKKDNKSTTADSSYSPYYSSSISAKDIKKALKKEYNDVTGPINVSNVTEAQVASMMTNLTGIFGLPYQFLPDVDMRIPGTSDGSLKDPSGVGELYGNKIISRMPLLFMIPCKQKFMKDFSNSDKSTALQALLSGASDDLTNVIANTGNYYTTEFDYLTYFGHVNSMCAQVAYFMGIADKKIKIHNKVQKIRDIDWGESHNDYFNRFFYTKRSTIFYVDGLDSISESFSNGTTESMLASAINGFSDTAKEIRFLLDDQSAIGELVDEATKKTTSALSALSDTVANATGGVLAGLSSSGIKTVAQGGKIIFPKIWQDSSFDRSYSFDIKLRSPDKDDLSIYLNILVPYIHLLAFVLPEGMDVDPNGYYSPTLVQAYSKGMFNINMGLITNMSVTRGATAQWSNSGIPTQIDVSITIEDLYSSLYLTHGETKATSIAAVVGNTAMMDFLSNLAGVNVAEEDMFRRIKLFKYLIGQKFKSIDNNIWRSFDQKIWNISFKAYKSL